MEGRVLRDNGRARRFAESLGYGILPDQEELDNQLYRITPVSFAACMPAIRPLLEGAAAKGEGGAVS